MLGVVFTFIVFLVLGSVMVYLAQNNLSPVSLHLGSYIFPNVPLFYVIIGSLLLGLGLAYSLHLANSIVTGFAMRGKDKYIKRGASDIVELTHQIRKLELENEKLKSRGAV